MRRVGLVLVAVVGLMLTPSLVSADSTGVLAPTAMPYGQSYGDWGADWWQWALAQPTSSNPILDTTGGQCANDQSGNVWFLAGSDGTSVTRACTVPVGKALFFPIINVVSSDPTGVATEEELLEDAAFFMDDATGLTLTIDGESVDDLSVYRFQSSLFEFFVPVNNFLGSSFPEGTYQGVTDGFYVMVRPLSPGEHTIEFEASLPSFSFGVDVTYHLTVGTG